MQTTGERSERYFSASPTLRDAPERVGSSTHYRWLAGIVRTVIVLNLCDAVLTLWWVQAGFATEANPFIGSLVEAHPLLFVTAKLALVALSTGLLWRHRERPLAVVGIFAAFLVYYGILLYHLSFASFLAGQFVETWIEP
ncbi:MAG: DUF5658 family protein [Myxococcota bacterium]|jgi:hypothetical protein|nr:DUF5658 family protein [Myxococcota bacterium]